MKFRKNKEIAVRFAYHGILFDLENGGEDKFIPLADSLEESKKMARSVVTGTCNQVLIRETAIKPNRPSQTTDIEIVGDWD